MQQKIVSIAQQETISNDDGFYETIQHYADFTGLAKVVTDFIKGIRVALKKREAAVVPQKASLDELRIVYFEKLIEAYRRAGNNELEKIARENLAKLQPEKYPTQEGIDSNFHWVNAPKPSEYDEKLTPLTVLNRIAWEEKHTDLPLRPDPSPDLP